MTIPEPIRTLGTLASTTTKPVPAILPEPEHVNLTAHLGHTVTAAEAVREGIATHAQKEHAARDEKRRQLAAQRRLEEAQRASQ